LEGKVSKDGTYKSNQERLMMEALDIINGSRRAAYGPPERNFERIAILWSAYLRASNDWVTEPIGAIDVCHMLDLVKLARLIETPDHEDSIRDRFGYQGCYVDMIDSHKAKPEEGWQSWPPQADDPPAIEPVVLDWPVKKR
jgi:hypothetical protein